MTSQDFERGLDFATLPGNLATGPDHNSLVDLTAPYDDGASEGKGLILTTIDTASATPNVPDPTVAGFSKWQRYTWNRIPFAGTGGVVKLYSWNPELVSDAIYLQWQEQTVDITAINNSIAAVTGVANAAGVAAVTALTTANSANATANIASAAAIAAQSTATNALNNAATAQAGVDVITPIANTANANATAALTAANANVPVTKLTPSAIARQQYRVNAAASAMEFFSPVNNYAILTEEQAAGTNAKNSAGTDASVAYIGDSTSYRILNNIRANGDVAGSPMVTLNAATGTFTLPAGTYLIKARACGNNVGGGADMKHKVVLKNVSASTFLAWGDSVFLNNGTYSNSWSSLNTIITIATSITFALDHVFNIVRTTGGLGKATNDGIFNETYAVAEILKLG